jgi:hypothetical protein
LLAHFTHKARFADARFAADERDLSLIVTGVLEKLQE